jgi:energy-coupling factor transporter ATP-binding protein EcfA2
MPVWDEYPQDYRSSQVQAILAAVRAGESVAVVGLSGAGKSNLFGFLAHRWGDPSASPSLALADCNRLPDSSAAALFRLLRAALGDPAPAGDELAALEARLEQRLAISRPVGLLLDRFDRLAEPPDPALFGSLRALRDTFKYDLAYGIAVRRPLQPHNELAELFFGNTLWLGPLSQADTAWNITRYARRKGLSWGEETGRQIAALSGSYPAFLRAVCEAHAAGCPLESDALRRHPAVRLRLDEFWADQPDAESLHLSGLKDHPLLTQPSSLAVDAAQLTAKEHLLWTYLQAHPGVGCENDDLIRAVWPEDRIFERGIRDDSLAQLVRRLREKVEQDPSNPQRIQTIPGRGYRFTPAPAA